MIGDFTIGGSFNRASMGNCTDRFISSTGARKRERERLQSVVVNWLFEKDRSLEREVACLRDVKSPGSHDNLSGNGPWLLGTLFLTLFWTLFCTFRDIWDPTGQNVFFLVCRWVYFWVC